MPKRSHFTVFYRSQSPKNFHLSTWAEQAFFSVPSHQLTKLSQQSSNLAISATLLQLWFSFHIRPSARHGLKFISGRHMRSKRRCSCVLQFTRLHAVSCVLHRPTSQVIHHSRLIFRLIFVYIFSLQVGGRYVSFLYKLL